MTIVESSPVYFINALLNCALDGMSSPLVGSSRNRYLQPSAKANDI